MRMESARAYPSSSFEETADYFLAPVPPSSRPPSLLKVVQRLSPKQLAMIAHRSEAPAAPTAPGLERNAEWAERLQALQQSQSGGVCPEFGRWVLWTGLLIAAAAAMLFIPMLLLRSLSVL